MERVLAENLAHASQDKRWLIMFAACTDAGTAHGAHYEALELLMHAGDTTDNELMDCEGGKQWSMVIN